MANAYELTWSRSGSRVAFTRQRDNKNVAAQLLVAVGAQAPRQIATSTIPIMAPTWARDGRSLAYISSARLGAPPRIVVVRIQPDGRAVPARVIAGPPNGYVDISWAPNGANLAVVQHQLSSIERARAAVNRPRNRAIRAAGYEHPHATAGPAYAASGRFGHAREHVVDGQCLSHAP